MLQHAAALMRAGVEKIPANMTSKHSSEHTLWCELMVVSCIADMSCLQGAVVNGRVSMLIFAFHIRCSERNA